MVDAAVVSTAADVVIVVVAVTMVVGGDLRRLLRSSVRDGDCRLPESLKNAGVEHR